MAVPRAPARRPVRLRRTRAEGQARKGEVHRQRQRRWLAILPARVRHDRPARLAAAAAVALIAMDVIPGSPSAPAIAAGCALWLTYTARADLAPPPGR
jgi:hypothetical protein